MVVIGCVHACGGLCKSCFSAHFMWSFSIILLFTFSYIGHLQLHLHLRNLVNIILYVYLFRKQGSIFFLLTTIEYVDLRDMALVPKIKRFYCLHQSFMYPPIIFFFFIHVSIKRRLLEQAHRFSSIKISQGKY